MVSKEELDEFLNTHLDAEVKRLEKSLGQEQVVDPNTGMTELEELEYCTEHGILMEPFKSRSIEELYSIADGMYRKTIFSSLFVEEKHLLGQIFLPVLLSPKASFRLSKYGGSIYADMEEAFPRSINGYPIFGVANVLNADDTTKLVELYLKIKEVNDSLRESMK